MGEIWFNGQSSKDYDIVVENPPNYRMPERDYSSVKIPGRNGDFIIDKKSFKNVPLPYNIAVVSESKTFNQMARGVSKWLHSTLGYARLEDSYDTEYYRIAMYPGSDEVENILSNAGRVTIVFNCKPQSFLKIGETPVTFPTSGSITNPTLYASEPIIVINGNGAITLTINDKSFSLVNVVDNITLNSELVAAYKGTELQNGNIRFTSFPLLSPGVNNISWTGTVTSVQIIPRWYTI